MSFGVPFSDRETGKQSLYEMFCYGQLYHLYARLGNIGTEEGINSLLAVCMDIALDMVT